MSSGQQQFHPGPTRPEIGAAMNIQPQNGASKSSRLEYRLEQADAVRVPGYCTASWGDIGSSFDDLFIDIDQLSRLEAQSLDGVLAPYGVRTVLDCACGTGIQAVGLAALGYVVSASDVSRKMVSVTKQKASSCGLSLDVRLADFRSLKPWRGKCFDATINCGNSLAVLSSPEHILSSLVAMRLATRAGGTVVVGVRDYSVPRDAGQTILPRRMRLVDGGPEWILDLRLFGARSVRVVNAFLGIKNGRWHLRQFPKAYLYLPAEEVVGLMQQSGLVGVQALDLVTLEPYAGGEWYLAVGEVPERTL